MLQEWHYYFENTRRGRIAAKYPVAEVADGVPDWRSAPPVLPALKDQVSAPAPPA